MQIHMPSGRRTSTFFRLLAFAPRITSQLGFLNSRCGPMRLRSARRKAAGERIRIVPDFLRGAYGHHVAAANARTRSEIDDQVGGFNRRLVMLDDQDAVADFFETPQGAQQHSVVARVKTDGGLIENVADAAQVGSELRRETDALRLAAGESVGAAVESEIRQANFREETKSLLDFSQNLVGSPRGHARRCRSPPESSAGRQNTPWPPGRTGPSLARSPCHRLSPPVRAS